MTPELLLLGLVALAAIAALPVTLWVLAARDREALEGLLLGQERSLDRVLSHVAESQSSGEPVRVVEKRLDVTEKELAARTAIAQAQARAAAGWDPSRDS